MKRLASLKGTVNFWVRPFLIFVLAITSSFSFAARAETDEVSIMEFFNADIQSVINYIADATGYTIIVDPSVRGKISLSAKEKITVRESISLIESILISMGYSLEKNGTVLKVVPIKDTSALKDIYTNANDIPPADNRLVTFIRPVLSTSGDSIMRTLRPFQSKFGNVVFEPTSKKLIITDLANNVKNISRLIDQLDIATPVAAAEKIETVSELVTLKNMDLDQAMKLLQATTQDVDVEDSRYPAARRLSPALVKPSVEKPKIQVIGLDRKDQLLLVGPKALVGQVKKTIEDLDERLSRPELSLGYEIIRLRFLQVDGLLDFLGKLLPPGSILGQTKQPTQLRKDTSAVAKLKGQVEFITLQSKGLLALVGDSEDRKKIRGMVEDLEGEIEKNQVLPAFSAAAPEVRIFPIQYAKSKDVLSLLTQLRVTRAVTSTSSQSSANAVALAPVASEVIDPSIVLIDHSVANSIIATGPEVKLRVVENLIKRLDLRSTQVLIEVKIMEVTYNRNVNLGLDLDNLSLRNFIPTIAGGISPASIPDVYNPTIRSITHGLTAPTASGSAPGVFFTFMNGAGNPYAIIQALGQVGSVNLVSTPNLITLDNKKATLNVVDRRAIVKQTVQIADSQTSGRDKVITTPEYKDAGIILNLTPRINDASNVSLDIDLTMDDFKESTTPGYPDISSRKITTEISVRDRTTAILGGIMKDQRVKGATGLPGVVEVPVVRNILGKTTDSTVKSELLIFLTPYIIYDDETLRMLSEKKMMETALNTLPKPKVKKPSIFARMFVRLFPKRYSTNEAGRLILLTNASPTTPAKKAAPSSSSSKESAPAVGSPEKAKVEGTKPPETSVPSK